MEEVRLDRTKTNELEFDVNIQGVDPEESSFRFIIENESMDLSFNCVRGQDSKWSVTVPPLPQLSKESYAFKIEAVIDGYFFETLSGTVLTTNGINAKASGVTTKTTTQPQEVKPVVSEEKKTRSKPKKTVKPKKTNIVPPKPVDRDTTKPPVEPIVEPKVDTTTADTIGSTAKAQRVRDLLDKERLEKQKQLEEENQKRLTEKRAARAEAEKKWLEQRRKEKLVKDALKSIKK